MIMTHNQIFTLALCQNKKGRLKKIDAIKILHEESDGKNFNNWPFLKYYKIFSSLE